jgi:hypothetical protein
MAAIHIAIGLLGSIAVMSGMLAICVHRRLGRYQPVEMTDLSDAEAVRCTHCPACLPLTIIAKACSVCVRQLTIIAKACSVCVRQLTIIAKACSVCVRQLTIIAKACSVYVRANPAKCWMCDCSSFGHAFLHVGVHMLSEICKAYVHLHSSCGVRWQAGGAIHSVDFFTQENVDGEDSLFPELSWWSTMLAPLSTTTNALFVWPLVARQVGSPVAGHHDLDITEHEPAPAEFSDDEDSD